MSIRIDAMAQGGIAPPLRVALYCGECQEVIGMKDGGPMPKELGIIPWEFPDISWEAWWCASCQRDKLSGAGL